MSWCPNCKTEYIDNSELCKECGDKLVNVLEKYDFEAVAYVEKEIAHRLIKLLHFSEIPEAKMVFDSLNDYYEIQVDRSNYKKATELTNVFKENEFDANYSDDSEFGSDEEYTEVVIPSTNTYVKTIDRYKDNLSTAYTFLICGCGGFIFLILQNLGILKILSMTGLSKILFNIVIGGLFIGFIAVGVFSLRYSKVLKQQAEDEEEFTIKLMEWLREQLTLTEIEDSYDTNIAEEAKYFKRVAVIKAKLEESYSSLDEEFLIKVSDDYYNELFSQL